MGAGVPACRRSVPGIQTDNQVDFCQRHAGIHIHGEQICWIPAEGARE
jgi:hypothetical protein